MAIGTTLNPKKAGIYRMSISDWDYYGSSMNVQNRFKQHKNDLVKNKHTNRIAQRAFNKYGNVSFCIVEYCPNVDSMPSSLIESEQTWIDAFYGDERCMNLSPTAGNTLGVKHSDVARFNMSKAHIGKQCGIFHPLYGKTWTEEQRVKYSLTTRGRKFSPTHKKNHLMAVRSKSSRNKISKAQIGRKHTQEHIDKRMRGMRGSDNVRAKKLWLQHESFGYKEFGCSNDAANFIGVARTMISNWLTGVRPFPGDGKIQRDKTKHIKGLKGGYL